MRGRKTFADNRQTEPIVAPAPVTSGQLDTDAALLVDLGECKGLGVAIIPAPAHEQTGIAVIGQGLFGVDAETVLVASLAVVCGDTWRRTSSGGDGEGFLVVTHARRVEIAKQSYDRASGPGREPQLEILAVRQPNRILQRLIVGSDRHQVEAVFHAPGRADVAEPEA